MATLALRLGHVPAAAVHMVQQQADDRLPWTLIALFAVLVAAIALLLVPAVRRRVIPVLAGLPADDGRAARVTHQTPPATAEPLKTRSGV